MTQALDAATEELIRRVGVPDERLARLCAKAALRGALPAELKAGDHDELVATLMAAPDSDWAKMPELLEKNREIVAMVRAGAIHDGDCTNQAHTCYRCLVEQYDKEARFVFRAIRAHLLGGAA